MTDHIEVVREAISASRDLSGYDSYEKAEYQREVDAALDSIEAELTQARRNYEIEHEMHLSVLAELAQARQGARENHEAWGEKYHKLTNQLRELREAREGARENHEAWGSKYRQAVRERDEARAALRELDSGSGVCS